MVEFHGLSLLSSFSLRARPLRFVYQYRDTSGDAASSAIAAAAGEVRVPGMAQSTLGSPSLVTTASLNAPGAQSLFIQSSEEATAEAPSMDPSPEVLLRSVNLCEQLITAFRVQEMTENFSSHLTLQKSHCARLVKKPLKSILPKVSRTNANMEKSPKLGTMPKCIATPSLNSTQLHAITESQYLCYVRTGRPLWFLSRQSSGLNFTIQRCQHRAFSKVSKTARQTVNSALSNLHKLSAFESKKKQRHMCLHLDGQLTTQTKRRFLSSMPDNAEELRVKYKIMTHCWLLAQMRQPGRHLYSDFTRMTFIDFLDELLSERNFLVDKTIGDHRVVRKDWSLCIPG